MLDFIYVNAASDFMIYLFVLGGSAVTSYMIWHKMTKKNWNRVNPENFNSRKTLFPVKVGLSSARIQDSTRQMGGSKTPGNSNTVPSLNLGQLPGHKKKQAVVNPLSKNYQ
jgi:hypothetical protein